MRRDQLSNELSNGRLKGRGDRAAESPPARPATTPHGDMRVAAAASSDHRGRASLQSGCRTHKRVDASAGSTDVQHFRTLPPRCVFHQGPSCKKSRKCNDTIAGLRASVTRTHRAAERRFSRLSGSVLTSGRTRTYDGVSSAPCTVKGRNADVVCATRWFGNQRPRVAADKLT